MDEIKLHLDPGGKGSFFIDGKEGRLAEMVVQLDNGNLTVFHTEVSEKLRSHGVAQKLLTSMVAYAREHQLKVIPLCTFVAGQFKRHPEQYADVWKRDWHR